MAVCNMPMIIVYGVLLALSIHSVYSGTTKKKNTYGDITLTNETCLFTVHDVGEDESVRLEWHGDHLGTLCRLGFAAREDNTYSICVKVETFRIHDCGFEMKYFVDKDITALKTYTCYSDSPEEYCGEDIGYLYIQFETTKSSDSLILLTVRADVLFSAWQIVLGVGFFALFVFCGCCVCGKGRCSDNNLGDILRGILECLRDAVCACGTGILAIFKSPRLSSSASRTVQRRPSIIAEPELNEITITQEPEEHIAGPLPALEPPAYQPEWNSSSINAPPPSYEDCVKSNISNC